MARNLNDAYEQLCNAYSEFKDEARRILPRIEFERWKAGGFLVDEDILSMYPNIHQLIERNQDDEDEEETDDE